MPTATPPGSFLPFQQQQHQLFAVADFKVGVIDVDLGLGYGLTQGSDRWMVKTILTYAFPVAGRSEAGDRSPRTSPTARPSLRPNAAAQLAADPFATDPFFGMR